MEDEEGEISGRPRKPGARRWGPTISIRQMLAKPVELTKEERLALAVNERPRFRRDCQPERGERPAGRLRVWRDGQACPWVSCRFHLAIAINPVKGGMKELRNWQDGQPVCVLDLAEEGGITLDRVGYLEGITRERVRQIEVRALLKLHQLLDDEDRPRLSPEERERLMLDALASIQRDDQRDDSDDDAHISDDEP